MEELYFQINKDEHLRQDHFNTGSSILDLVVHIGNYSFKAIMKGKSAFPNEYFKSLEDYVDFAKKHQTYGSEAYALKRRMTKQIIPMPKIALRKEKK